MTWTQSAFTCSSSFNNLCSCGINVLVWFGLEGGALQKVWRRHHPHPVSSSTDGYEGHAETALWTRGGTLWILRVCECSRLNWCCCNILLNMMDAPSSVSQNTGTTDSSSKKNQKLLQFPALFPAISVSLIHTKTTRCGFYHDVSLT